MIHNGVKTGAIGRNKCNECKSGYFISLYILTCYSCGCLGRTLITRSELLIQTVFCPGYNLLVSGILQTLNVTLTNDPIESRR